MIRWTSRPSLSLGISTKSLLHGNAVLVAPKTRIRQYGFYRLSPRISGCVLGHFYCAWLRISILPGCFERQGQLAPGSAVQQPNSVSQLPSARSRTLAGLVRLRHPSAEAPQRILQIWGHHLVFFFLFPPRCLIFTKSMSVI
jgi:hypothetical protein